MPETYQYYNLPITPKLDAFRQDLSQGDILLRGSRGAMLGKLLGDLPVADATIRLIITPNPEAMEDIATDITLFAPNERPIIFPPWDVLPDETDHIDLEAARGRMQTLRQLLQPLATGQSRTIVTTALATLQQVPNPQALHSERLIVQAGMELPPLTLAAKLSSGHLESVARVETPGQFCRHGGILDVYPHFADNPWRLEYFDDEIESIRPFDPITQLSGQSYDLPVTLLDLGTRGLLDVLRQANATIYDYLIPHTNKVTIFFRDPERSAHLIRLQNDDENDQQITQLVQTLQRFRLVAEPAFSGDSWPVWLQRPGNYCEIDLESEHLERLGVGQDTAVREMRILSHDSQLILVVANATDGQMRLDWLKEKAPDVATKCSFMVGKLSRGFHLPTAGFALLAENDVAGRESLRRPPKKRSSGSIFREFQELSPGDYVSHADHGIAIYEGMNTLTAPDGSQQDYLTLRFDGDARIYVPLSHVDLVQRYVGGGDFKPSLSSLGGASWKQKRSEAEKAARNIAGDLLRIQAMRRATPGYAFPPDDTMMYDFENTFPYEETPDQLAAISAIKEDQERPNPMDRLLCGDVGFGKTEVAMRAAFKAVLGNKQVAVLAPTTILAEQHYRTFSDRMAKFAIRIGCLSRLRSTKESKDILENVKSGRIDILIGTHRILSKDVTYANLGLAVIDEEQRFGVEHKERLKHLRAEVDVLTLTATPIPRTLHMSLLGLRDISTLSMAPAERQAIRTLVAREDEHLIRRAIIRELSRGGQVFFLHNRIRDIDNVTASLIRLVPEARFDFAHGSMNDEQLMGVMDRFLQRKIDVLVTTTIVESGVDIPSVNTLIVHDAHRYGLSQLHQLRGRVGRYRQQAYAYFLVPKEIPLKAVAEKRLQAIEEYTDLGAGFRLAMRDMEIRGAGNILGSEQSGHIAAVGFEMYCRLLEKAVKSLQGQEADAFDPVELDIGSRAFLPDDFISYEPDRIEFYRQLAEVRSDSDVESLRLAIRDRYGASPLPLDTLYSEAKLRWRASQLKVERIGVVDDGLTVTFTSGSGNDAAMLLPQAAEPRRVTPMGLGKWRIGLLGRDKRNPEAIANLALLIFDTLIKMQASANIIEDIEDMLDLIHHVGKKESLLDIGDSFNDNAGDNSGFRQSLDQENQDNPAEPVIKLSKLKQRNSNRSSKTRKAAVISPDNVDTQSPKKNTVTTASNLAAKREAEKLRSAINKSPSAVNDTVANIKPANHEKSDPFRQGDIPLPKGETLSVVTVKGKASNFQSVKKSRVVKELEDVDQKFSVAEGKTTDQSKQSGVEIDQVSLGRRVGELRVQVQQGSFSTDHFGSVTLKVVSSTVTTQSKRSEEVNTATKYYYLYFVGTYKTDNNTIGLVLMSEQPEQSEQIASLAGTTIRLFPGVVED